MASVEKKKLVAAWSSLHLGFLAGIAGADCLMRRSTHECLLEAPPILKVHAEDTGGIQFNFSKLAIALSTDPLKALLPLFEMQFVSVVFLSYEQVNAHCERTNQAQIFSAQPWHFFYKQIRNCLAHNMCFEFLYDSVRKQLPARWNGLEITEEMEAKPFSLEWMPPSKAADLLRELESFINEVLE